MRFLAINPNTTDAMTRDIEGQARLYASPDTEVEAISPRWGPASIEGHLEDELAAVATLEAIAERSGGYDGVIIACYGDPGLYAARELSPVPVVGIAEASMLMACMVAHRFSVVTVLPRIRPMIEDVVARYGMTGRCASVRATPLAVLDIERDPDAAERDIAAEAARAIAEDGAEAICLGCAGMGPLDRRVQGKHARRPGDRRRRGRGEAARGAVRLWTGHQPGGRVQTARAEGAHRRDRRPARVPRHLDDPSDLRFRAATNPGGSHSHGHASPSPHPR